MKKEVRIIFVALLFIFAFLFLKEGITGMYMFDARKDICQYNTQCLLPKVCCKFYQEDSGICDYQNNCHGIYLATRQEKMQLSADKLTQEQIEEIAFEIEKPEKIRENSPLILIGLILLILAAMYLADRKDKKKKKKIKKVKKKKR